MSDSREDIQPELIEQVDELLEQIEETTKAYTSQEERDAESGALLADDGVVALPNPETSQEADAEPETGAIEEAFTDSNDTAVPATDSIAGAQQALDAIEEIEQHAEGLMEESIDALLDSAESSSGAIDIAAESEPNIELDLDVDEIEANGQVAAQDDTPPVSAGTTDDALEGAIDALLEETPAAEVDEELESMLKPVAEPEPDPVAEEATAPIEEALLEDEQQPTAESEPASLEEIEASLLVEKDTPSSDAMDDSMDLLDSALAEAADDMLEGDFETEEGELVSGEAVASEIEKALQKSEQDAESAQETETKTESTTEPSVDDVVGEILDGDAIETAVDEAAVDEAVESDTKPDSESAAAPESTTATQTTQSSDPEPAAVNEAVPTEEPTSSEPEPAPLEPDTEVLEEIEALEQIEASQPISVPAWFERGIEIVRPKIDRYDPLKGKTMDAVASVIGTALVMIITHATPIGAKGVLLVSKPLSKQSTEVRNAVGYIALWTGFLAMVVWVYLLMFRAPHIPQPDTAPSRVIDATEPLNPDPAKVLPES